MEVFFYGLFMDESILRNQGLNPENPRIGYVNDYTLIIGNRASLAPSKGESAFGIVITVDESAVRKLYEEPSVADYIPEEVNIVLENREQITAICYNLPAQMISGANVTYASKLFELARRKGLPVSYLQKIEKFLAQ